MPDSTTVATGARIRVIHRLISVTIKIHTQNNKDIKILGAVILRMSEKDEQGQIVKTRQMTCIIVNLDKLFIIRKAGVDLGMISERFPTVGDIIETQPDILTKATANNTNTIRSISGLVTIGACPKRQLRPSPPTKLLYIVSESNRWKLRKFLLEYYTSNTFNACDHQPLPLMNVPSMRLMVNTLHCKEKVGLDQDVRLGVLQSIPIEETVTWCHLMVVCAKQNETPRRTVDFQPLNVHDTRETYHTPSPFHQASLAPLGTMKAVFDALNGYHSVLFKRQTDI